MGTASDTLQAATPPGVTIEIGEAVRPSRHGPLFGFWNWFRRSVLRRWRGQSRRGIAGKGVVRKSVSPASIPTGILTPNSDAIEDDAAPLEPVGAKVREQPAAAKPAVAVVPMGPVRDGLSVVPPLPHVVRELMRELSDPASSSRSIARIAATDPALAATLLRTVNSAAVGLRRKVTSVADAVSFLGFSLVRSLVIRMRLDQVLATRSGQPAYDQEDLWVHSLAVAYAAEVLAERVPGVDKGFVSTLGLLHDIGKLAINSQFPESAELIRTRSNDSAYYDESFLDRERRILGADHAEIGAILAGHWKLPPDLIEAIRWHHCPQDMPATLPEAVRAATIVVHVANQLTKYCYVYSEDMEIDIVQNDLLKQVGLPGPVTRLLNVRLKQIISRAIFFADETSRQPLGAIRRFVRLTRGTPVGINPNVEPNRSEPHVGRLEDEWEDSLPCEPATVDCDPRSGLRLESTLRGASRAGRFHCLRFTGRATSGGVDRILSAIATHQDALKLSDDMHLPFRFVLRRLIPNLKEIEVGALVDIVQCLHGGQLIVAMRSTALRYRRRFGEEVSAAVARAALDRELANVLNLRWFSQVRASRDGETLLFVSRIPGS